MVPGFWAPDNDILGSPLRFEGLRWGVICLVFKERPFGGSTELTTKQAQDLRYEGQAAPL
jgi:hypothetical protein